MSRFLIRSALILAGLAASAVPALPNQLSFTFGSGYSDISSGALAVGSPYSSCVSGVTCISVSGYIDQNPSGGMISGGTQATGVGGYLYLDAVNSGVETWYFYSTSIDSSTPTNPLLAFTAQTTIQTVGSQPEAVFSTSYRGTVTMINPTFATSEGFGLGSADSVVNGSFDLSSATANGTIGSSLLTMTFTPEPASFLLFGTGLAGALLLRRRALKQIQ